MSRTKKQDRFDRMAERLDRRIRIWVAQGVPFDDVLAAALRRVDRAARIDERKHIEAASRHYDEMDARELASRGGCGDG